MSSTPRSRIALPLVCLLVLSLLAGCGSGLEKAPPAAPSNLNTPVEPPAATAGSVVNSSTSPPAAPPPATVPATPPPTTAPATPQPPAVTAPAPIQPPQPVTLSTLTITPGALSLDQGSTAQLVATGLYSDGSTRPLTSSVTWQIAAAAASISSSGLLQALLPGTVSVRASVGGVSATASLTINAAAPVPASFQTTVAPLPDEDLETACSYDLFLPDSAQAVSGVWVLFERVDTARLWQDPDLQALALRLHLALLYAHQCNAASYVDLQSDARKGPARALDAALTNFASVSGHPEIANANLILFGFSAAGVLSLTTAEVLPARVLTVITYAAGSVSLKLPQLSPALLRSIPILLLSNALDNMAGSSMNQAYFRKGRASGAPWAFAVQPGVAHCCTLLAAPILLSWVADVVPLRASSAGSPTAVDQSAALSGTYTCTPDNIVDGRGYTNCSFTTAVISTSSPDLSANPAPSAISVWLPSAAFAVAWQSWAGLIP